MTHKHVASFASSASLESFASLELPPRRRSLAATWLAALDAALSLSFLAFAILHTGLDVPLGFVVLEEPRIVPATIVEGLCALALGFSAAALFGGRPSAWRTALTAHLFALAGVLLGIFAGRGAGSTASNMIYHFAVLTALLISVGALLSPRITGTVGSATPAHSGRSTTRAGRASQTLEESARSARRSRRFTEEE